MVAHEAMLEQAMGATVAPGEPGSPESAREGIQAYFGRRKMKGANK